MLHRIRRRVRKSTKAFSRSFGSSSLGRAFGSKSRNRHSARPKKWIQKVTTRRKKGVLRKTVKSRYGRRGFDKHGRIKSTVLEKMAHEKGVTGRRARFAKQLRRIHHR